MTPKVKKPIINKKRILYMQDCPEDNIKDTPVSIIIACLFEEDTIGDCIERISKTMKNAEIIVVHGGTDKTYDIAKKISDKNPKIIPIRNKNDKGKGHAIKVGISRATYDIICQFDADLQFEPENLPNVLAPLINDEADIVIGSRFLSGADASNYSFSFFRSVGNWIVNRWVSLLIGRNISDVTTGYKAWTRKAINSIDFRDDKFVYEVEIPMRAVLNDLRIAQVPVNYYNRKGGISGHGTGINEINSLIITGILLLWKAAFIRFFDSGKRKTEKS